jgi:N-acetylglucosamine-6-phosphate deacetylase
MASTNPARWHGLDQVGTIEVGRRADLCRVDDHGQLRRVMQAGEWVAGVGR